MDLQPRCVAKILSPPQLFFGTTPTLCDPKKLAIADPASEEHRGSIIIVIATDAPLTPEQLKRLARHCRPGPAGIDPGRWFGRYLHRLFHRQCRRG
jgi:L-aminopeptidase/D-esterase-like protein